MDVVVMRRSGPVMVDPDSLGNWRGWSAGLESGWAPVLERSVFDQAPAMHPVLASDRQQRSVHVRGIFGSLRMAPPLEEFHEEGERVRFAGGSCRDVAVEA